ncbi:MAG: metal ABC transporter permease [Proteobacteria bacterium]|nr:metal ABC transporter permease [Pseudomonadota bacterium]MDA1071360.1 metal ABC transporter permease [Pseudomonadota bacterium]
MIFDWLIAPFLDYAFMARALAGALAVSLGAAPVGVFLMLRRMSLTGEAIAHGVLPGIAVAYLLAGLSLFAMTIGGLVAGLVIATLSALVSRLTVLREDASLASFHLVALAMGVLLVSVAGSKIDLIHVLFGSVLALGNGAVLLLAGSATLTVVVLALIYRPLVMESYDPAFLRAVGGRGALVHHLFLALVVLNLVAGFHALGTLMSVGMMILPATAARFWARGIGGMIVAAVATAVLASVVGLLISFHIDVPSGPAIILVAGAASMFSMLLGPHGSLRALRTPAWHRSN